MHLFVHTAISIYRNNKIVAVSSWFVCAFLTRGETLGGTAPGFPRCACDLAVPGRAGVWCSTPSEARTPSPLSPNTAGWCSWNAAAAPTPCTATCPSQMICPARKSRTVSGRLQGNLYMISPPPQCFIATMFLFAIVFSIRLKHFYLVFLFYYLFII